MNPGRPEPTEYGSFFATYIGKTTSVTDPIDALTVQLDELLSLLRPLNEERQLHAYAEGKWTIRQVLGHLTDAERIFSYRVLRIARNDKTPLSPFDENNYVSAAEANGCEWTNLLDEFEAVRKSTILLLRNMPDAAWTRMGVASGAATSVRAMVYVMIGHVTHHLQIVRERYLV